MSQAKKQLIQFNNSLIVYDEQSQKKPAATWLRKSNFIMFKIPRVVIHPSFDDYTFENDYALIELEESIDFKADFNVTAPCCLPTEGVGEGQKEYVRSGFHN